jgi:hypothetical protein
MQLADPSAMAIPNPTRYAGGRKAEWLHWLYVRGNHALSCDVDVRGEGVYVLTLLPLWSPEDEVTETFRRPGDALRRHAELIKQLQDAGWLMVEGGPVTNAA